jgi:3-hydroxy-9,10-secoandrosta-1,3,5(10)-triene-9,17-dione monooxygenase
MFVTGPRIASNYRGMRIPYEEAIERARTIVPVAERNALATEELRRMPEENVRAIMDSGLMPLVRPRMFGGYEADWMTQIDCVSEVARVCGSTGWCMTFLIMHQYFLTIFPLEAQRAVYEEDADPTILTSFQPQGTVKEVPGGYEVSGTWPFASAGDYCRWAIIGVMLENPDGSPKKRLYFLLRPEQFRIERTWDGMGLKGSGSQDVIVDPTFVPTSFSHGHDEAMLGTAEGQSVHDGVLYRAPLVLNQGFAVMSPMFGIAQGAWEAFVAHTKKRAARPFGAPPSANASVHNIIGESAAEIDLAYLITEKLSATVFQGGTVKRADALRHRRDMMYIKTLLQGAVDKIFFTAGSHAILGDQPIQRFWRDLHAAANHAQWSAPAVAMFGRQALGLPPLPNDGYPAE